MCVSANADHSQESLIYALMKRALTLLRQQMDLHYLWLPLLGPTCANVFSIFSFDLAKI